MDQKLTIQNKVDNVLKLAVFGVLFLLAFILPLKFSLPFAEGISEVFPSGITQWFFYSWPSAIAYYLILFAFFLTLARVLVAGQITVYRSSLNFWIGGFLIALILSFYFSINTYRSSVFVVRMFMCFILYYVVVFNAEDFGLWKFIFIAFLASAILVSVYGIYQFNYGLSDARVFVMQAKESGFVFSDALLQRLSGNRIFSTFVYPNALAGYFLFVLPIIGGYFFCKGNVFKSRLYIYPLVVSAFIVFIFLHLLDSRELLLKAYALIVVYPVVAVLVFFMTFSKGGVLSFLVAVFISMLAYKKSRKKKIFFTAGFFFLLAMGLIFFFVPELKEVIVARFKANTLAVRLEYWKISLAMWKDFLWLGCGSDNFGLLYPLYWKEGIEITQMAHNNYLQILAETGIVGGLFFMGFVGTVLFYLLRFIRNYRLDTRAEDVCNKNIFSFYLSFALLAVLIHWLVDFDIYVFSLSCYFTFFLGLFSAWALNKREIYLVIKGICLKILIGVLVCFICFFSVYLNKKTKADYHFYNAEQFRKKGNFPAAIQATNKAIELEGENYRYSFFLGQVFYKTGFYPAALYWFQKAVAENKYLSAAYRNMADIYEIGRQKGSTDTFGKIEYMLKKACFYAPHKLKYKKDLSDFYRDIEDKNIEIDLRK